MLAQEQSRTETGKAKVLIVDDHPIVRERLADLINREEDLTVCGEAEDRHSALRPIEQTQPSIVILDLTLKRGHGLEVIKDIRGRTPELPVLILSMHDASLYAERALNAGAKDYITRQNATTNIIAAIHEVLNGNLYFSDEITMKLLHGSTADGDRVFLSPLDKLSDRELEVLEGLGRGYNTRQIGEVLGIETKTVETYRSPIKEKLGLRDALELTHYAVRWYMNTCGVSLDQTVPFR